jgi:hypothetical protein
MAKHYLEFDPKQGYPKGSDLWYECQRCHTILPSNPAENVYCKCYNIIIDVDAGRFGVQDDSLVKLLRIEPDKP